MRLGRLRAAAVIWMGLSLCAGESFAYQRMGIVAGSDVSIEGGSTGELAAFCLDSDESIPTVSDSFDRVLNEESLSSVVVETGGRTMPLDEAIRMRLVSLTGVAGPGEQMRFNAVRVNNLTDSAVFIHVKKGVVVGGSDPELGAGAVSMRSFAYDVTPLLNGRENQASVWSKLASCKRKAGNLPDNKRSGQISACLRAK